ncbi:MAG: RidA family protein [Chloroflexi bacterium]|nr:RidA family protein [Chloroflexota bacterium]
MEKIVLPSEYRVPRYYPRAVIAGPFVFLSGVCGIDAETGFMAETLEEQTHLACKRIGATLEAAGTSFENVVKVTIYLKNRKDGAAMSVIRNQYFTSPHASTIIGINELGQPGRYFEIDVTAMIPDKKL